MRTPPKDLGRAGRALYRRVVAWLDQQDPPLELDPHELVLLTEAAGIADRLAQLRTALDGADFADATTMRLLAEERQQRVALSTLLISRLGLPTGLADAPSSPRGRRAQRAASARWSHRPGGSVVSDQARLAARARWGPHGA